MYTAVGRYQIKNTNALIETRRKIQKKHEQERKLESKSSFIKFFNTKLRHNVTGQFIKDRPQ